MLEKVGPSSISSSKLLDLVPFCPAKSWDQFNFVQQNAGKSGTQFHFVQQNAGKSGTQFHFVMQNAEKSGTQFHFVQQNAGKSVHFVQQNAGKSGTQFHFVQEKVGPISSSKLLAISSREMLGKAGSISILSSKMLEKVGPSSISSSKLLAISSREMLGKVGSISILKFLVPLCPANCWGKWSPVPFCPAKSGKVGPSLF